MCKNIKLRATKPASCKKKKPNPEMQIFFFCFNRDMDNNFASVQMP